MDPRYTGEILKHLEKQNEYLLGVYNSMSHELHDLQAEEEMLMRKCYAVMKTHVENKEKNSNHEGASQATDCSLLLRNDANGEESGVLTLPARTT